MVDKVEEAFVGPMQVLEDEHERSLLRHRLEEAPPSRERLVASVAEPGLASAEARERAQMRFNPIDFILGDQLVDRA